MNNTKWNEIFIAFYDIECSDSPSKPLIPWMTQTTRGFVYGPENTWTHFGSEPADYKDIEWLKIILTPANRDVVLQTLKEIHVPGEVLEDEVIVYGYRHDVDYI